MKYYEVHCTLCRALLSSNPQRKCFQRERRQWKTNLPHRIPLPTASKAFRAVLQCVSHVQCFLELQCVGPNVVGVCSTLYSIFAWQINTICLRCRVCSVASFLATLQNEPLYEKKEIFLTHRSPPRTERWTRSLSHALTFSGNYTKKNSANGLQKGTDT